MGFQNDQIDSGGIYRIYICYSNDKPPLPSDRHFFATKRILGYIYELNL